MLDEGAGDAAVEAGAGGTGFGCGGVGSLVKSPPPRLGVLGAADVGGVGVTGGLGPNSPPAGKVGGVNTGGGFLLNRPPGVSEVLALEEDGVEGGIEGFGASVDLSPVGEADWAVDGGVGEGVRVNGAGMGF